jgi:uncharacterized heparinase superfamily protein
MPTPPISAASAVGPERLPVPPVTRGTRQRFRDRVGGLLFDNPLYPLTLKGRRPAGFALMPEDPWPGDAALADQMFRGRFRFAGEELQTINRPPWDATERSATWAAELHGFAWLRHFRAAGGDAARRQARALLASWLTRHSRWDRLAWRPDVLACRLIAWASNAAFLFEDADAGFRGGLLASFAEQSRHLARTVGLAPAGPARFVAVSGLIHAGLCLAGGRRRLGEGARLLQRELAAQVLGDGGHVSRSPALQLQVLRDLVALRSALTQAKFEVPVALQSAIDRLAPMLRFYRHGDGRLALFHGTAEADGASIELTLDRADASGKPLATAPHSRYERAAARRALLLLDVGSPPGAKSGVRAHAGSLAFEFSIAKERLIVNCGAAENPASELARALRATAAHSTLTLADTNAAELPDDGRTAISSYAVTSTRNEAEGNVWLDASHDGYVRHFGLTHRRRLYLEASGDELRGEDSLIAAGSRAHGETPFAIRFHLHPDVDASLVQNRASVLLKLPSGAGYRMRVGGGTLKLEESLYLGTGQVRRAEQIVVVGTTAAEGETRVKWALGKIQPPAPQATPTSSENAT